MVSKSVFEGKHATTELIPQAVRALINDLTQHTPTSWRDVLAPNYEAINGWMDIGASKMGYQVTIINDTLEGVVEIPLTEMKRDAVLLMTRLAELDQPFQLVVLYMRQDEEDDADGIALRVHPRVQYVPNEDHLRTLREDKAYPTTFRVLP